MRTATICGVTPVDTSTTGFKNRIYFYFFHPTWM